VLLALGVMLPAVGTGQSRTIAAPYEVATWRGFRTAAVSYTFDDGTANQLPVAIPIFNEFGYRATLFTVTGWVSDWAGLQAAAAQGHEIASHTVDHVRLGGLSVANETYQYEASKSAIESRVAYARAVTIAYPNCRSGDQALCAQYYAAGRNCTGGIVPPTPANFYEIGSYICGNRGTVKTASDFTSRFNAAQTAGGWLVLLLHGIDNDGGYSPLPSLVLRESLQYLDDRRNIFWVEAFGNIVRYIKERDDISVAETSVADAGITLRVTDTLDDAVYNYPVTLRRPLPAGWTAADVTQDGQAVPVSLVTINSVACVIFDVVPDAGEVVLSRAGASQGPSAPAGLTASAGNASVSLDWSDNGESDLAGYNVYRSTTPGSGYVRQNGPLVTSSAYSDTTVVNGTPYFYVVTAANTAGHESPYSIEASATPAGTVSATTLHVDSIVVSTVPAGGPNKKGRAAVVIRDNNGSPVANATVSGTFTGTLNETAGATTDSTGTAVVQTNSFRKTISSLTFCVTAVAHATLTYVPGSNVMGCDSLY
jgi:oligosaccharide reducing-end xylanase